MSGLAPALPVPADVTASADAFMEGIHLGPIIPIHEIPASGTDGWRLETSQACDHLITICESVPEGYIPYLVIRKCPPQTGGSVRRGHTFGSEGRLLFHAEHVLRQKTGVQAGQPLEVVWLQVEGGGTEALYAPAHDALVVFVGNNGARETTDLASFLRNLIEARAAAERERAESEAAYLAELRRAGV